MFEYGNSVFIENVHHGRFSYKVFSYIKVLPQLPYNTGFVNNNWL